MIHAHIFPALELQPTRRKSKRAYIFGSDPHESSSRPGLAHRPPISSRVGYHLDTSAPLDLKRNTKPVVRGQGRSVELTSLGHVYQAEQEQRLVRRFALAIAAPPPPDSTA